MTTLYLDRRDTRLKLEGRALAIYTDKERRGTVPLNLLESVVMRSAVSIESSLLANLADAGIAIVIFGGRNASKLAIVHGRSGNDGARRVGQLRLTDDLAWCLTWTRRLVRGKLRRQQRLIVAALRERPDLRLTLTKAREQLMQARAHATDPVSASIDTLRGIEGAGAAAYFKAYCGLFAPELDFTGRNRRPPRDPVNAVLSLAYTLLHAEAVHAAYGAGLDPIIGYYHTLDFGRESLASDLIEPLRPLADTWVWEQFRTRHLRPDHFSREGDACLLGKAGREHFYSAWQVFVRPHRRLLRRASRKLAGRLAEAANTDAIDPEIPF
ncbi:CRISPR-associated endonuclease Cas1 [Thiorhodovibrio frisius]|uniref:CRISPR-associated endonuclease Cas1 n=1 Tax=Thiorhodovibrio frisius TaxID=631362 RepID=H8Z1Q9_9GAMM|nr:CRISPR-associated endonuclease Cas1 [Thiorhodovibrio frisius]EIC21504.1 CRISPR-associated endonuclease Cas1 [Thiorhodovibrio frisius]WPL24090.1 CRISPR-associated protein Cas4/endonuclease Cas1 fusion [Thiorhodovibrio frisius]